MTEQWQELKETIIEMRDNDGICTQQETCKFLANLMDVLEKQMKDCGDVISREATLKPYKDLNDEDTISVWLIRKNIEQQPSVNPQEPKTGHWIRVTDEAGHLVWECDKCCWQQRFNTNFCPDCGARMIEPQESEDKK